MNLLETFRTALSAIFTRKLRSALTMLGILIGIASVMLTVGLGQGAQYTITQQINKLGSNMLMVTSGTGTGLGGAQRSTTRVVQPLTLNDATALADKTNAPDILRVAPVSSTSATASYSGTSVTTTITGTSPDWLQIRARTLTYGRFFTDAESAIGSLVAVIGPTTSDNLFGTGVDPVGRQVTINGQAFTIIGELEAVGQTLTGNEDDQLVIPSGTYAVRLSTTNNMNNVTMILLEAKDQASLSAAQQQATATMLVLHKATADAPDFSVSSQQALVDTIGQLTAVLTALLSGLAGISLVVGGIGVMNIMLVSVTERIREIGLRKALGARPSVILQQFLVEASVLGLMGGALGVALGVLGGNVLSKLINQPIIFSAAATIIALAVSLIIGIVAGVYPAWRAAKLAPIDALRNE